LERHPQAIRAHCFQELLLAYSFFQTEQQAGTGIRGNSGHFSVLPGRRACSSRQHRHRRVQPDGEFIAAISSDPGASLLLGLKKE